MYVCVCKAVTDAQVQDRVAMGGDSVRALSRCTGLGTECGKCIGFARERIAHHQSARHELGQQVA
ncbi:MAG: (2Fe-2S)-binding protein [Motiliproteus sp.]